MDFDFNETSVNNKPLKMAEEQDRETTFSPTNSSKEHLNASKFHKTTSECWQRTSGTQKRSSVSSKGGRKKYKTKKEIKKKESKISQRGLADFDAGQEEKRK